MSTGKVEQRSNDLLGGIRQDKIVHERFYYHSGTGK